MVNASDCNLEVLGSIPCGAGQKQHKFAVAISVHTVLVLPRKAYGLQLRRGNVAERLGVIGIA